MRRWTVIAAYLAVFWLLLPAGLLLPHLLWRAVSPLGGQTFTIPVGAVLVALGVVACGWGIVHLIQRGRGLPISHLPPRDLVTTGPYAYVRHPVYLGYGMAVAGTALLLGSVPMLAVSLPAFATGAWLYTSLEERVLEKRFGGRYRLYRLMTPRLLPGRFAMLTAVGWSVAPFFRLRVVREAPVPEGGFIVICPHNNYLDPGLLALGLGRRPSFLVTHDMYRTKFMAWLFGKLGSVRVDRYRGNTRAARLAVKTVAEGGVVVLFPEGGRSWFGDGWYPASLPGFLARTRVPVMPATIEGAYWAWPRWGRPALAPVTVRLGQVKKLGTAGEFRGLFSALRQTTFTGVSERKAPGSSEGLDRILYCCAACGEFGSIIAQGPLVSCGHCRAAWTLLEDGRLVSGKSSITLSEWHRVAASRLKNVGEQAAEVVWCIERETRDKDIANGASVLRAAEGHVYIQANTGEAEAKLTYGQIDAVLIRANDKLQLYAKGVLHTLRFDDGRALLFQELLRLRAFGSVFQRRRGQEVTVL